MNHTEPAVCLSAEDLRTRTEGVDAWKDASGLKVCVVQHITATPVEDYADIDSICGRLDDLAETAAARSRVLRRLAERGWQITAPRFDDSDGVGDVVIVLRKAFATHQDARDELTQLDATQALGFAYGWNEQRADDGSMRTGTIAQHELWSEID